MSIQYIKFNLSPGQKCPTGSTGKTLSDGYIVWEGEKDTFDSVAKLGKILISDPEPNSTIENYPMTAEEITEYLAPKTICPHCGKEFL